MSDHGFETRLVELYAGPPQMDDADAFAARLERRLDRRWALRRVLITGAGVVGGAVAAAQLMSTHLLSQADAVSRTAAGEARRLAGEVVSRTPALHSLPFGGEAFWLAGGLAVAAAALLATRALDEL